MNLEHGRKAHKLEHPVGGAEKRTRGGGVQGLGLLIEKKGTEKGGEKKRALEEDPRRGAVVELLI